VHALGEIGNSDKPA